MTEKKKGKLLQWHPAFYAGIQIELAEEAVHLIFENEHILGNKPMQIDVLIIKKNTKDRLKKNIGRIFRTYNIIEYKSPEDYLSIDDFYKVYGYTCFFKSDTGNTNEVKIEELTVSFVCSHYPRKLVKHLEVERHIEIERQEAGIYYIRDELFPIQLIITNELSEENNLWLKSLTNDLKGNQETEKLLQAYKGHKKDELYISIMDVIVRANEEQFVEVEKMCNALMELMKDEIEEIKRLEAERARRQGLSQGLSQGEQQKLFELITKKLQKGKTLEVIADELEETVDVIQPLYNQVKEELGIDDAKK